MPNRTDKLREALALRASATFFLRSADTLAKAVGDGDFLRGIIFLAIVEANVRHLRPGDLLSQTYSEAEDQMPDDLRRPISVHALAHELDLPYETTRRHVNRLMSDGLCIRAVSGMLVPGDVLAREVITDGLRKNFEHLRQLFSDLRDGGVDLTP